MFDTFQNKISKESIHSFTIAYLRQQHLKLCEMVELANAVFSPLLFVIISMDVPLICINTYHILKLSSEAGTIAMFAHVYWGIIISALLIAIFIFGNRVNVKVSLLCAISKHDISLIYWVFISFMFIRAMKFY